jgi:hypothetical protein
VTLPAIFKRRHRLVGATERTGRWTRYRRAPVTGMAAVTGALLYGGAAPMPRHAATRSVYCGARPVIGG